MDVRPPTIVDVRIEHVTIEGLGELDRASLAAALERDLARLVSEHGIPAAWAAGAHPAITANLRWNALGGTNALSSALAEQIYRGFGS
ncbi:MAG: hypothetical protein ABWX65_09400 [Mycetocola sp.]